MPPKKNSGLVLPRFSSYFFVAAVVGILGLFFWVVSPFFSVLIFSALIAIFFDPLQKFFTRLCFGHNGVAAFLSTLTVFLVLVVPLVLFSIFLVRQSIDAYVVIEARLEETSISEMVTTVNDWIPYYDLEEAWNNLDLQQQIEDNLESLSGFVLSQGANVLKILGNTMVGIFILVLTTFFLFKDGRRFLTYLKHVSPLPLKYEEELEAKLRESTHGIVVGNFGTAVLQGAVGAIGFAIAGIENAVLWGTVMAFASLIPYVGATVIWGPAALLFLFQQEWGWGIFLVAWGLGVVATVDNIARPFLIGGSAKLHPLPTFLVVLGGIFIFGLKGIIFGPLILSLTITILHIYELEYGELLQD